MKDAAAQTIERADALSTKRATLRVFATRGSAQVFVTVAVAAVVVRSTAEAPNFADLTVVVVTLTAIGPVEWIIHRWVLHGSPHSWMSRRLGTGTGHRQHHVDPPALDFLLLAGTDAAVFMSLFLVASGAWALPLAAVLGAGALSTYATAVACAAVGLAHYEWVHLLVHTRYRCRSGYYARLARNHRLHHFRNEDYWLGVTTNSGDRVLGTYPSNKSEVELSDTARTLGS
ncbi:MAG: sterol desaturase family protein [Ilumatobacter sp.]